jgi:hypothetical protein
VHTGRGENQKTLFNDRQTPAEMVPPQDVYQEPTSEARSRIEGRTVEVFLPTYLTDAGKWSWVEAIVEVGRHRLIYSICGFLLKI